MTVRRLVPSDVEAESLADLLADVRAFPPAAFSRLGRPERGLAAEQRKTNEDRHTSR